MNSSHRSLISTGLFVAVSFLPCVCCQADSNEMLRSAYLGSASWSENLSSAAIKTQLQDHFTEVINQLQTQNSTSLLKQLNRVESALSQRWSKSERLTVLNFLLARRLQQIQRLRYYRDRGLFPVNHGESDSAVPIFVDRNQTHCAVGYLMHSDGDDDAVREIVEADNLVYVNDVTEGSLLRWIRTSGLTQEEAAMIQPAYPIPLDATFQDLTSKGATVERNGFVLSEVTLRGFRFFADGIPDSFETNPEAIYDILEQGKIWLIDNDVVTPGIRQSVGVLFGSGSCPFDCYYMNPPSNLPTWLYIGSDDEIYGGFVGSANSNGDTGIAEIKYTLRTESGEPISELALTSFGINSVEGQQSALLVLSEIYDGETNELLATPELFATGVDGSLVGSEQISLDTDMIRVTTYGLVVGSNDGQRGPFHSYYHELLEFVLGDVNQDGMVNLLDVEPFLELLVAGEFQSEADVNQDGVVNLLDVAPMVDLLSG